MLSEKNRAIAPQPRQLIANGFSQIELFAKPRGKHLQEGAETQRRNGKIRFKEPGKLGDGFVVKHHCVEFACRQAGFAQAIRDGLRREALIVLAPAEAFFLRGADNLPIAQQRGGGIVIISGDAEDVAHVRTYMKGYINGASTELELKRI